MTFLLDNLTAVLVGTTLLAALLVVQQRGQQGATEAAMRYQTHTLTTHFLNSVERDIENVRSRSEVEEAFDTPRFSVRRDPTDTYTAQFVLPTLAESPDAATGEVAIVTYHVTPTGDSVSVNGTQRATYRARRYIFRRGDVAPVPDGGSSDLIDFDVTLYDASGAEETHNPNVGYTPSRVHVTAVAAAPLPERRTYDQSGSTPSSAARHARTVRVASAGASGGSPPVDRTESGAVPALPGD